MKRFQQRATDELRPVSIERQFTKHAEGSVLITAGATKVLCNASVIADVPRFLKGSKQGWVTAEYAMLPRATHERTQREVTQGKASGRTSEIQRLIGRSLRAMVDLKKLNGFTLTIDCDVLQADGGTRTASITGACVALCDALQWMQQQKMISASPLKHLVAAISVGMVDGTPLLDLDYAEDSRADTDLNLVMDEHGKFIEIQGTAEACAFSSEQLTEMVDLGKRGIQNLIELQRQALSTLL